MAEINRPNSLRVLAELEEALCSVCVHITAVALEQTSDSQGGLFSSVCQYANHTLFVPSPTASSPCQSHHHFNFELIFNVILFEHLPVANIFLYTTK